MLSVARREIMEITQGEFSVNITITNKTALKKVVKGLATKHNLIFNPENGLPINAKNTHVSISETVLAQAGFSVRNANLEVDLKGWKIEYADSSGASKAYRINDAMPDETLGLIVCTLGDAI